MKNVGITGAVALVGIGLISIALSNVITVPQAMAARSAVVNAGPDGPQIVWYGTIQTSGPTLLRAWSDGTVEGRLVNVYAVPSVGECRAQDDLCFGTWVVIASPTEGMNAAADINFDGDVDGADLGLVLSYWGDAPRSPIPASDCPLGLMQ